MLLEGPPDADELLEVAAQPDLRPPVALLVHAAADPGRAVFYPFAEFSPEWRALSHAVRRGIPARFMDLPQSHRLAFEAGGETRESSGEAELQPTDALEVLARAAGHEDGESWWSTQFEERHHGPGVFAAVLEVMSALRGEAAGAATPGALLEARREAYMRRKIREAEREQFRRIAVVCGAWHAPVLTDASARKEDASLLEGLPVVKTAATWVPWSHDRLALRSGYGAGVPSPAWYHHLWSSPARREARWLARAAKLLRDRDLDASPASVIEAQRLAEALAALRGRPVVGLGDLLDAVDAVLTHGNPVPLRLIQEELIVGRVSGGVPVDVPRVPLQRDLEAEQRRLRLPPEGEERRLELDLREPTDLARSQLLHRLLLLDVNWGTRLQVSGARGTFREAWSISWRPELVPRLIDACRWGSTVAAASAARAGARAREGADLGELAGLLDQVLLAHLEEALPVVLSCVQDLAASAVETSSLLAAVPPLASAARYGDVRGTSPQLLQPMLNRLVARSALALVDAARSIDDEAARDLVAKIQAAHTAVLLLDTLPAASLWLEAIDRLSSSPVTHGFASGRATRLLVEARRLGEEDASLRLAQALSPGSERTRAALWIEGFVAGSGLALVVNPTLWILVDSWLISLTEAELIAHLPLLRRAFSGFSGPEIRKLAARARAGGAAVSSRAENAGESFDQDRASRAALVAARLLGLEPEGSEAPDGGALEGLPEDAASARGNGPGSPVDGGSP